jgi:hypothetical protein
MSYPSIYSIAYNYTGFQQSQGNNSFPGTQLDSDLAGLQSSVSSLALFVKGVMRSDGALANGSVTYDSLAPSLQTAGLAPANAWVSGVPVFKGQSVIVNSILYRCLIAHTSGVFATDLAAGLWVLVTSLVSTGAGAPVFNVANYISPQAACTAANSAGGGVVYFPAGSWDLGSGSVGLNLDSTTNVRLTGPSTNGGVGAVTLAYSGTGTAISAKGSTAFEFDHLTLTGFNSAFLFDFGTGSATNTTYPQVHDNVLAGKTGTTIVINNVSTVGAKYKNNTVESGLTGIRGVVASGGIAAGQWAVKTVIEENTFQSNLTNGIQGATDWTVSNNIFQGNLVPYAAGYPGTCTTLLWTGNHMEETTSAVNQINSNAALFTSIGNTYSAQSGGTAITQANGTGAVVSIGDSFNSSGTWINIGTGNLLTLQPSDPNNVAPVIVGTPATQPPAFVAYGSVSIGTARGGAPLTVASVGNGAAPGNAINVAASDYGTNGGQFYISKDSGTASAAHIGASDNGAVCPVILDGGPLQLGGTLAGRRVGTLAFQNATSGLVTLAPATGALGTSTLTLPAATDTLVGQATSDALTNKKAVLVSSPSGGGLGYATGAGGTVVQATSKATGVALNAPCGQITLNNAALAAATIVSFTLTNTAIGANDVLVANHISGGTVGAYSLHPQCAAGSATINVRNNTAGSLSEAIVIQFALIKGANS